MIDELETVVVQITSRCPFNCPQCYMEKNDLEMDEQLAYKIVNWAKEHNAVAIQITGGEPLTYPFLDSFIRHCYDKGLLSFLSTSGYLCSAERLNELQRCGLSAICISLNGMDEAIDRITRDTYQIAKKAVVASKDSEIETYINCVATQSNIDNLPKMIFWAKEHHVSGICLLRPFNVNMDMDFPDNIHMNYLIEMCEAFPDFLHVENCFLEYWSKKYKSPVSCKDAGRKSVFFCVNGAIKPCSKAKCEPQNAIDDLLCDLPVDKACLGY